MHIRRHVAISPAMAIRLGKHGVRNWSTRGIIGGRIAAEDRAALIANTEVAGANSGGALVGMKEAQDAGVGMLKEWGVDSDPCPICEENADAGPIPLDEDFPSGDDAPQAHPGCLCVLVGVVTDEPAAEEDDQADLPDESEE